MMKLCWYGRHLHKEIKSARLPDTLEIAESAMNAHFEDCDKCKDEYNKPEYAQPLDVSDENKTN